MVIASLLVVSPAAADRRPRENRARAAAQIQSLREQVSEASGEETALLARLEEVQGRRQEFDARVADLGRRLAVAEREAKEAEARLEAVHGDFVRAQTQLALARDHLATAHAELRDRAVQAYLGNSSSNAAGAVLQSRDVRELNARVSYLESVGQVQQRTIERFRAIRDSTAGLQAAAETKKDEAKAQRDVVVARQAAIEVVGSQLGAARQDVVREESHHQALLGEVRGRVADFEAQIAVLRADSDSVGGLLRGAQVGQGLPAGGRGLLATPLPGAPVSSTFGPRVHPILGSVRMHDGLDFRAPSGTPIRAAGAGTVVYAGWWGGYGNATVVDHGGSVATLYAHQSTIYVRAGTTVARGQVIGAVGSTGFSTGPHLHFEVRVNGVPVNPLAYL